MCTDPAAAGEVRAAMPRPAAGSAADPIALEPADDVVITTLVDNIYDALLTGDIDCEITSRAVRPHKGGDHPGAMSTKRL